ncbi:MAG: LysM repeat protein [Arcticibacterium sp.]|jgi:LysM repeat protein
MEFEDRNKKPEEPAKNLPMAVLITLVGIVCLLLYVGWEMISDDASKVSDLSPGTSVVIQESEAPLETEAQEDVANAENSVESPNKPEIKVAKPAAVTRDGKTAFHTIQKGETLFSIATRYNLSVNTLKASNPSVSAQSLAAGSKLKVPVLAIHTVGAGDILRVVGGKYGITVKAIMAANGKTKNFAERGEKLIIPFKEKQ